MKKILKIIICIIGGIITFNGIALFFVSNINLGNFLTVILGGIIVLVTLTFKKLAKLIKVLLVAGILITVISSWFLIIYGKSDNVTYSEDAIIVLGAAVHGKIPSLTLERRLNKAAEYHNQNPDAIIIVSGGQGAQEVIPESEAMKNYLIEKGVNSEKIVEEIRATSTYENFSFSKEILDKQFGDDYTVCFITNEYHILRSLFCAKQVGISNVSHLHSNTNLSYIISGFLRECLAVIKYMVLKN